MTDLTPAEAARRLWGHRSAWLDVADCHGGAGAVLGSPADAVGDLLVRMGLGVEWWSGTDSLVADPEVYRSHLAREAHSRVLEVRRVRRAIGESEPGSGDTEPGSEPEASGFPTLREWLDRRPGGGWWLAFLTDLGHTGGGHVLLTYGSTIIEGGPLEEYAPWKVWKVLRVFPEKRVETDGD